MVRRCHLLVMTASISAQACPRESNHASSKLLPALSCAGHRYVRPTPPLAATAQRNTHQRRAWQVWSTCARSHRCSNSYQGTISRAARRACEVRGASVSISGQPCTDSSDWLAQGGVHSFLVVASTHQRWCTLEAHVTLGRLATLTKCCHDVSYGYISSYRVTSDSSMVYYTHIGHANTSDARVMHHSYP